MKSTDVNAYNDYQQRICSTTARVDNKPPRFRISSYYKPRNLYQDATRIKEIDKENMELLKRLNVISRLGGKVDCHTEYIKFKSNVYDKGINTNEIMTSNKKLLHKVRDAVGQYSTAQFLKDWRDQMMRVMHAKRNRQEQMDQRFMPETRRETSILTDVSLLKVINPRIRTKCFFEIEIQETKQTLGNILFELYDDIVPQTCANFKELCRGVNGLSYKGTPFHRIVPGYWCQGGDVTKFNGSGGSSIYGDTFENENFYLRHVGPGILSMCNDDEAKNNSKFNLTFTRLETMNGGRVVFGNVISGLRNVYKIEEFGTKTGKPITKIIISNCGIIPGKNIASSRTTLRKYSKANNETKRSSS